MIDGGFTTIGTLVILAGAKGGAAADKDLQKLCEMPEQTKINVLPKSKDVAYDFSQDLAALQNVEIDTINPYGFHQTTETQGFMKGAIQISQNIQLKQKFLPKYNALCLQYDTIDIVLEIDPKIVIAKEVAADRCMKKATLEHEMKHVKVDRQIVNKYAKSMGKKVYDALKQRGFVVGPVPVDKAQDVAERMQQTIFQIVEFEYKKLDLERQEKQGAVDSLEEYERVSGLCPNFDPAKTDQKYTLQRKK